MSRPASDARNAGSSCDESALQRIFQRAAMFCLRHEYDDANIYVALRWLRDDHAMLVVRRNVDREHEVAAPVGDGLS